MKISNIKSNIYINSNQITRDVLDFCKIKNTCLSFGDRETILKIKNGDIIEKEVTIKYFNGNFSINSDEYSVEIVTVNNRKKKKIENSQEPIFLKGTLKYNSIKDKFVLTSFEKIDLFFDLNDWISIISQLSFDEVLSELLSGLNMNSSKLLPKEKNMFLLRLVPLVQSQFLLVDFSKRATRKTRTYSDLGYHIPATYNFTRAKMIYDQSQRKKGLIFSPKGSCLILDEFQNNTDDGITMAIQQYKNDGTISDDKGNIMPLNTSVVILGNPKILIEYPYIFTKWQNIFEGTTIYRKNFSTGDAFLSRVDYLIPSWESRVISNDMILNSNAERIPPYILRSVFSQLREIDISDTVKTIIKKFNFKTDISDSRSQKSIERTFEGLIKLLLPQLIKNDNYENYQKELRYLYSLSLEGRIIINNILQKIKPENIPTNFYFSTASYFNKEKNTFILPHRKITIRGNEVIKEALDNIGILQNQEEITILKKSKVKYSGKGIYFQHPRSLPNLFKYEFLRETKSKFKKHKMLILGTGRLLITGCTLNYLLKSKKIKLDSKDIMYRCLLSTLNGDAQKILKNLKANIFDKPIDINENTTINNWNNDIFFNYLLGEYEVTSYSKKDIEILNNISFYHRIKK